MRASRVRDVARLIYLLCLVAPRGWAAAPALCTEIMGAANGNRLERFLPFAAGENVSAELPSYLPGAEGLETWFSGIVHDVVTHAPLSVYTSNSGHVWVFDEKSELIYLDRPASFDMGERVEGEHLIGILRRSDREYLVYANGVRLSYVAEIGAGPSEKIICHFQQREQARARIVSGTEPVCRAVSEERVQYVPFEGKHTLTNSSFAESNMLRPFDVLPGVAQLDVDDDGTPDRLARYVLWSHGGNCGFVKLAQINKSRDKIIGGKIQELIDRIPVTCNNEIRVFMFEGQSYFDARTQGRFSNPRHINRISSGQMHQLCELGERTQNILASPEPQSRR